MNAPQRIVSLLSSATEMLHAVGVADRVVAVSHECDYPAPMRQRPRATRSRIDSTRSSLEIDQQVHALLAAGEPLYEVDGQLLERLAPQLIVTQAQCDVCAVRHEDVLEAVDRHLGAARPTVLALNPTSLEDVLRDLERVGEAAGAGLAARRVATALQARAAAVRDRARRAPRDGGGRPRVVCVEWIEPLMVAGNWTPRLIEWAGGQSGLAEPGRHSPYRDWAALRAYDPEVIIVAPCGFDLPRTLQEAQGLARLPGWKEISAVRAGRVFALDGNAYLNRSGPRLVTTLEILFHLIQSDDLVPPDGGDASRVELPGDAFCRLETRGDRLLPIPAL